MKTNRLKERVASAVIIILSLCACNLPLDNEDAHFIYVAHTRLQTNDSVYKPIYDIEFSNFDVTLLGGDLALDSFSNDSITHHLDDLFNLKSPNTLWSIGNHDDTSLQKWKQTTLKEKYHTYTTNDVVFIAIDSQDSLSSIVGKQKDFLLNTLKTIQTGSVIIMSHKLIFMNGHSILDSQINQTVNGRDGDCFYCHNDNNFYEIIYPKLLEVKERGVQIFWVGGDLGYKTSHFEFIDENGITFLGNGLWYPKDWNKVLIFSKEFKKPVTYKFVSLDSVSLINNYSKK